MVRASAAEVTVPAFKKQHLDKFHSGEGAAFGAIHSEISIATGDPISPTVRSGGRGGLHPAARALRTEDMIKVKETDGMRRERRRRHGWNESMRPRVPGC